MTTNQTGDAHRAAQRGAQHGHSLQLDPTYFYSISLDDDTVLAQVLPLQDAPVRVTQTSSDGTTVSTTLDQYEQLSYKECWYFNISALGSLGGTGLQIAADAASTYASEAYPLSSDVSGSTKYTGPLHPMFTCSESATWGESAQQLPGTAYYFSGTCNVTGNDPNPSATVYLQINVNEGQISGVQWYLFQQADSTTRITLAQADGNTFSAAHEPSPPFWVAQSVG